LIGDLTSPERLPDKFRKPYWNPVIKAGHIWCPKLDSLVCKTGYSGFDRTDTLEHSENKFDYEGARENLRS
jgi:hypothetical protein